MTPVLLPANTAGPSPPGNTALRLPRRGAPTGPQHRRSDTAPRAGPLGNTVASLTPAHGKGDSVDTGGETSKGPQCATQGGPGPRRHARTFHRRGLAEKGARLTWQHRSCRTSPLCSAGRASCCGPPGFLYGEGRETSLRKAGVPARRSPRGWPGCVSIGPTPWETHSPGDRSGRKVRPRSGVQLCKIRGTPMNPKAEGFRSSVPQRRQSPGVGSSGDAGGSGLQRRWDRPSSRWTARQPTGMWEPPEAFSTDAAEPGRESECRQRTAFGRKNVHCYFPDHGCFPLKKQNKTKTQPPNNHD